MVEQVWHKGHTFLSRELNSSGGVGLGGVGLVNVFEWRDTALFDSASVADLAVPVYKGLPDCAV